MDNRIFNVNGITKQQLELAVKSDLLDSHGAFQKVKGWYFLKEKGLVLSWLADSTGKAKPFTDSFGKEKILYTAEEVTETLWAWLSSEQAKEVVLQEWEHNINDADDDVMTELGWRLYTEDWGHIHEGTSMDHYSMFALKPCYAWFGK
jgi:hypothetical protein